MSPPSDRPTSPAPPFDDERPTSPASPAAMPERIECPACKGEDGRPTGFVMRVLEEGASGHRRVRETCHVCLGARMVSREVGRAFGDPRDP